MSHPLGQHSLFDFNGCDVSRLTDTEAIRVALIDAVREAGGTIVTHTFHTFSPHGVSGVIVIAESHVTIHTWPEYGYAAVDVFSCGASLNHDRIRDLTFRALAAARVEQRLFSRGAALAPLP